MAKYGSISDWGPREFSGSHGIELWKSIIQYKAQLRRFTSFEVGSDVDIRF